ncbi:MAG: hypothetical protein PVG39_11325 [Desulfobacteraceae bacterium]|jgi:hypothetical protein
MAKKKVETEEQEAKSSVVSHVTDAQKAQWKNASATIWKPEEGEFLIGVYDGCGPLPAEVLAILKRTDEREIKQHFFVVGEGETQKRYSLIGGQVFDSIIASNPIEIGTLCRIEYLGQRDTSSGNRANDWDVKYQ